MPYGETTTNRIEQLAKVIVDAAFTVHKRLGPGLLESTYEMCLYHELTKRGIKVQRQLDVPVRYDDLVLETGFRLDLLVDDLIIVELKAVERMIPLFSQQLLTHLRLANKRLGFLINFNVSLIKDGIHRIAN